MGYAFDLGLEKEMLRYGGLDLGRERGAKVGDGLDLGLKCIYLQSFTDQWVSLFHLSISQLGGRDCIRDRW